MFPAEGHRLLHLSTPVLSQDLGPGHCVSQTNLRKSCLQRGCWTCQIFTLSLIMLKDLPLHTRQSLYRCLNITSEQWIEDEPEQTWAKYTAFAVTIEYIDSWATTEVLSILINSMKHSLFDIPCQINIESQIRTESRCWWLRDSRRRRDIRKPVVESASVVLFMPEATGCVHCRHPCVFSLDRMRVLNLRNRPRVFASTNGCQADAERVKSLLYPS